MISLIFKSTNPTTRIGVSNLKDETEKATLAKFGNNVKDFLGNTSSNYLIIIDNGELHYYYGRHIFRALFSVPNSSFNCLVERTKYYCDTET